MLLLGVVVEGIEEQRVSSVAGVVAGKKRRDRKAAATLRVPNRDATPSNSHSLTHATSLASHSHPMHQLVIATGVVARPVSETTSRSSKSLWRPHRAPRSTRPPPVSPRSSLPQLPSPIRQLHTRRDRPAHDLPTSPTVAELQQRALSSPLPRRSAPPSTGASQRTFPALRPPPGVPILLVGSEGAPPPAPRAPPAALPRVRG